MKKIDTRRIAIYGIVAAIYAVLTIALAPYSFYGIQFRIGEALVLLAYYKRGYIVPLTLGCAIANLFSPMFAWDMTMGVFATFLSVVCISLCKNLLLASFFPVVINAVVVSIGLKLYYELPIPISMLQVAFGELVCVTGLGLILFNSFEKNKNFMRLIKFE